MNHIDILYPKELYELHEKVKIDREAVIETSLIELERKADKILNDFLEKKLVEIGRDRYAQLLVSAATKDSKILYALRCCIASMAELEEQKDEIIILDSKQRNGIDFFKDNNGNLQYAKTYMNDEGEEEMMIDMTDDDDPYSRAKNSDDGNRAIMERISREINMKDVLPKELLGRTKEVLRENGYVIEDIKQAYDALDEASRKSSVESIIIARLYYLVTNANYRAAKVLSDGKPELEHNNFPDSSM